MLSEVHGTENTMSVKSENAGILGHPRSSTAVTTGALSRDATERGSHQFLAVDEIWTAASKGSSAMDMHVAKLDAVTGSSRTQDGALSMVDAERADIDSGRMLERVTLGVEDIGGGGRDGEVIRGGETGTVKGESDGARTERVAVRGKHGELPCKWKGSFCRFGCLQRGSRREEGRRSYH